MEHFATPFALFLTAAVSAGLLAVALPFALWYYYRAKEIAPLLTKKKVLEEQNKNLEEEAQKKRSQIDALTKELAQARKQIADGEEAKKWIENSEKVIDNLKVRTIEERGEYQKVKNALDGLNQIFQKKGSELVKKEQALVNVEEEGRRLQREKDDLARDISRLSGDKKALQNEKEQLTSRVNALQNEKDYLEKKVVGLEEKRSRLDQMNQDCQTLKQEKIQCENELRGLKQQISNAEDTIAKATTIRKNEANMWKDLERPIALITNLSNFNGVYSDETTALGEFKKALDKSHFRFEERTIKAFHTGLLSGGVSPLVVLSGISGTGKSLLPELYAKFFKMNFLPVAVQPRWDGPQDVFGFYNHMEGRFKATELSRLLWQFDIYNNEKANKDNSRRPMSLVLLDEMNLARVEYYFSELLSKLEIRNRLENAKDVQSRKPAEIELEYGSSSVTQDSIAQKMDRRLFVDRNILFVGTMNEDESTQTLSSKVIDRSNVLRFGTPESLSDKPSMATFQWYCNKSVSYANWLSWAKKKNDKTAVDRLDDKIQTLKTALTKVDRGFGHRTENAIKTYVDFYPGNKNHALADQIEMKILPKLNGIETDLVKDQVASSVRKVLYEIRDTDVCNAFDDTLQSESAFFTWKGVRR